MCTTGNWQKSTKLHLEREKNVGSTTKLGLMHL